LARFTEWARQYGGIFSLKLGTGTAIVLTDRRLVKELIDKRSAIYSDRPTSYVIQKLVTNGDYMLTMKNDADWRKLRKLIHQQFNESMCETEHVKLQNAEAIQMIRDFINEPENFMLHPKRFSNSVVMSICRSDGYLL
jgi:cytochrome P450